MRYLGNKTSILKHIYALLKKKDLLNSQYTFFDAFTGTGSVADAFKDNFNIIVNDNLNWSVIYTQGKLMGASCTFDKLGANPFDLLNNNSHKRHDFFYMNYAPTHSSRMYFTPENAERIDYFRWQIEEWFTSELINQNEYHYLLACLIESLSLVANVAGVYGAFLKKWDNRALKKIQFIPVEFNCKPTNSIKAYCKKIEDIIKSIDCDILYLDPPYTQNQYGTQYHLLETLVLNDNPSISKVTGSRPTAPMRSDWSKDIKVHILFNQIIRETKAKHIIFSYSSTGIMSKDYIEATLKRYGKKESYICQKISYKKYQNWKSQNQNEHFEYLFYIEKKEQDEIIYESPLNYTGSKIKSIPEIRRHLPQNIHTFIDAFSGGFNVGANIVANDFIYNDINHFVADIFKALKEEDTYKFIKDIKKTIDKYGLKAGDKEAYTNLRSLFNTKKISYTPQTLFTLIMYGFQQQIRFNSKFEFNNPVGMRWFNDNILEKLISFSSCIKNKTIRISQTSYQYLQFPHQPNTFWYFDPPYMLTTGAYNDGKRGFYGWNKTLEQELFAFCNTLNKNRILFMLSYVVEHKGEINTTLLTWVKENNYRLIELTPVTGVSGSKRKEVLIVNYA